MWKKLRYYRAVYWWLFRLNWNAWVNALAYWLTDHAAFRIGRVVYPLKPNGWPYPYWVVERMVNDSNREREDRERKPAAA